MPILSELRKFSRVPISLVFNGVNPLGIKLIKSLLEQKGYVILVDSFTKDNMKKVGEFKDNKLFSFIDEGSAFELKKSLNRLDYVFFLANAYDSEDLSTRSFLHISNNLDVILSLSVMLGAKFLAATSLKTHRMLISSRDSGSKDFEVDRMSYSKTDIQKYVESLVFELSLIHI